MVRARAANPGWIAGMKRHGFRGAAEIAATLEHLAAFAQLAHVVPGHLFDAYFDATPGTPDTLAFLQDTLALLQETNPAACAAMRARFDALHRGGIWQTRRNSIAAALGSDPVRA
ncbi:CobN/magnesium chelatase [Rhodovulum imhoffii]|uniref:CobN/magnesium chelatase n=1 Tax=Rhodovulum imhoffii TaxID=365340 RepID=A0A2T5BRD8_9RHOB|nr:CobN/magnesium chelatase [Rhodovulum imhoffii]